MLLAVINKNIKKIRQQFSYFILPQLPIRSTVTKILKINIKQQVVFITGKQKKSTQLTRARISEHESNEREEEAVTTTT